VNDLDDSVSQAFVSDWRGSARRNASALPATDGRWALVSTSLTAVIAGSVAWLAMGTMPPPNALGFETARHGLVPYALIQQLLSLGGKTAEQTPAAPSPVDKALQAEQAKTPARPTVETRTVSLEPGDTLAGALEDAGISADDANAAIAALGKVYDPRDLRAGQSFDLTYNDTPVQQTADASGAAATDAVPNAQLLTIKFSPSIEHDITVTRAADGSFASNDDVKQLTEQTHRAGATIDSSLYLSAMQAGIPAEVVRKMIDMFSYKVDFQRDIRPGDSFEVYYDYYYTPDGKPAKDGNITYARMKLGGRDIALYRYQADPDQPADYFDAKGQSAKGMLMKTPVDGARITSGFGMRFHPILGYTRMHKGIDFGVPIGTPVMAAGSGTIETMGWENGYGNFVLINHGNGYETAYGHLSRFAPGLHKGSPVHQAQVVAYSGMTGMATGPHLHYEIRIDKVQVNPLTVKVADGRLLTGKELREFEAERMKIDGAIVNTKLETRMADESGDLRQAK
jgi:murein DD-endopeptidase MepM/ murein hydrolase activator NlpD